MKYATFDANGVLNARYDSDINEVIPAESVELTDQEFFRTIEESDGIWTLLNGSLSKIPLPPPTPVVPKVISMRQARLALHQSGYLSQVDSLIAGMSEASRITWDYATEVRREHPLVASLAANILLSDKQLDDLFTLAATL